MKGQAEDYYGLIFNCPVGEEVDGCKYRKIRKLPVKERLAYFNALTEREIASWVNHHKKCLSVREKVPFSRIAIM
jgi:hypothetical protein